MENIITKIKVEKSDLDLDYKSRILLMGSCFSDNIGTLLEQNGFAVLANPMSIAYNPHSILRQVLMLLGKSSLDEKLFVKNRGAIFHFDFHSNVNGRDIDEIQNILEDIRGNFLEFIKNCSCCILTLGTAWVYRHIGSNTIVCNCHKQPSKHFEKELLSIEEIIKTLYQLRSNLKEVNSNIEIIYTVSPVRHLKDGMSQNLRSKSRMIEAVHSLVEMEKDMHYFPAYEIVMDELRDYRYYAEDMIHPSNMAIKYIYRQFLNTYMSSTTQSIAQEQSKLRERKKHVLLFPNSIESKDFVNNTTKLIEEFRKKYPDVNI